MRQSKARGFTLIEIVVVIVVLAILIAMAAALTRGVIAGQKRSLTVTRMQTVDAALVQFVTQQKRLPCPADGGLPSTDSAAGRELPYPPGAACAMTNGVVPWRTLGLAETDATDGWDRRLTYRPSPDLALANAMDMAKCDPAGNWTPVGAAPYACNGGCSSADLTTCTKPTDYLNGRGLRVKNVSGTDLMEPTGTPHTGAAYVVISHGESGGGGYLGSGTLGVSTVGDGSEEMKNYASLPYVAASTYYVDSPLDERPPPDHFDDLVSRPSVLSVITKAGLGPRSH